ncbi:hypothetical protein DFH11DRAFT_1773528 [Phellopilus nigrolimitatus]|nr:hypothetical protein DFH11DRAFT_1773528 [Phellopilus nigrolimitatus]
MAYSSRPTAPTTLHDNLNKVYAQVEASLSESSISTDATADDLPGPGRLLGNLFMFLGRRLEAAVNRFAEKRGYGPVASRKRLVKMSYDKFNCRITPVQGTVEFKRSQKEVKRLLKYVKSKYVSNQVIALEAILGFSTHDHVRQTLIELNATRVFGLVALQAEAENCDQLLSPSRKALICLVDVDINEPGKRLLDLVGQWTLFSVGKDLFEAISLEVSFLVLRYIEAASFFVIVFYTGASFPLGMTVNVLLYVFDHAPSAIEWNVFTGILLQVYRAIQKPTEENIELVQTLASVSLYILYMGHPTHFISSARSFGDVHDTLKEDHRRCHPEFYLRESRTNNRSLSSSRPGL